MLIVPLRLAKYFFYSNSAIIGINDPSIAPMQFGIPPIRSNSSAIRCMSSADEGNLMNLETLASIVSSKKDTILQIVHSGAPKRWDSALKLSPQDNAK